MSRPTYSEKHPHEDRGVPPALRPDGGCEVCGLEVQVERLRQHLATLTEGWALELVERIERTHNEFQRLGLVERCDNRDSEAGRKCLSSMATDAVYFASLIRDVRAEVGGNTP